MFFFNSLLTSLGFHFKYFNTRAGCFNILCNLIVWQMSLLFDNHENWAISRSSCCWVHLNRTFR